MMQKKRVGLKSRGQGLVEYLILLSLISVSAIGIVSVVGVNVKEQYRKISNTLRGGRNEPIQLTRPNESTYKMRGMDDYEQGAERQ